jgi:hypothetical protein
VTSPRDAILKYSLSLSLILNTPSEYEEIKESPTKKSFTKESKLAFSKWLSKDVCDLACSINPLDFNEALTNVLTKVMIFYGNVPSSRIHLGSFDELNTTLVVFKDCRISCRVVNSNVSNRSDIL